MPEDLMPDPPFLPLAEVARQYNIPENTLRFWRAQKTGPPSAKIGRRVVYRPRDIEAWIDAQFDGSPAT